MLLEYWGSVKSFMKDEAVSDLRSCLMLTISVARNPNATENLWQQFDEFQQCQPPKRSSLGALPEILKCFLGSATFEKRFEVGNFKSVSHCTRNSLVWFGVKRSQHDNTWVWCSLSAVCGSEVVDSVHLEDCHVLIVVVFLQRPHLQVSVPRRYHSVFLRFAFLP